MRTATIAALTCAVLISIACATNCLAIDFPYRSFAQTFGQAAIVDDFSFDDGNFAFRTFDNSIYSTDSGSPQLIATDGTFIQAGGFFLQSAGFPSLDGHTVVFTGYNGAVVLRSTNGSFTVVADSPNSPWPGYNFGQPIARDGRVAYIAWGDDHNGIVVESNGAYEGLVQAPPYPGIGFGFPNERISYDGQHAAYIGYDPVPIVHQYGVYKDDQGSHHTVADINTPIPGGTGSFSSFGDPAIDAGHVAFVGAGPNGQSGIYSDLGGTLTALVDRNTPVPGGGQFLYFQGQPAFDRGHLAFVARILDANNSENFALFTDATGSLTRIVTERDHLGLDDRVYLYAYGLGVSRVWLRGNELAFNTFDTLGDIYVVTVPEPSSFVLAGVGFVGMAFFFRRRFIEHGASLLRPYRRLWDWVFVSVRSQPSKGEHANDTLLRFVTFLCDVRLRSAHLFGRTHYGSAGPTSGRSIPSCIRDQYDKGRHIVQH